MKLFKASSDNLDVIEGDWTSSESIARDQLEEIVSLGLEGKYFLLETLLSDDSEVKTILEISNEKQYLDLCGHVLEKSLDDI